MSQKVELTDKKIDIKEPLLKESHCKGEEASDVKIVKSESQTGRLSLNVSQCDMEKRSRDSIKKLQSQEHDQKTKSDKLIDFNQQMYEYRMRTEHNYPYTMSMVEDVMFCGEGKVVALEYIFYDTTQGIHSKLKKLKKNKNMICAHKHNPDNENDECGVYKKHAVSFQDSEESYIDKNMKIEKFTGELIKKGDKEDIMKKVKEARLEDKLKILQQEIGKKQDDIDHKFDEVKNDIQHKFLDVKCGEGHTYAKAEAIISMWKVGNEGELVRINEESFYYPTKFQPTQNGWMMLQLSQDKKLVHLIVPDIEHIPLENIKTNTGLEDYKVKYHLYAWSANNLKAHHISGKIMSNISKQVVNGKLFDNYVVSNHKSLCLKMKSNPNMNFIPNNGYEHPDMIKAYHSNECDTVHQFFDLSTGEEQFRFSVKDASILKRGIKYVHPTKPSEEELLENSKQKKEEYNDANELHHSYNKNSLVCFGMLTRPNIEEDAQEPDDVSTYDYDYWGYGSESNSSDDDDYGNEGSKKAINDSDGEDENHKDQSGSEQGEAPASGTDQEKENIQKDDDYASEKHDSVNYGEEKQDSEKKASEKQDSEKQNSEKQDFEEKQDSEKKASEKQDSEKQNSEKQDFEEKQDSEKNDFEEKQDSEKNNFEEKQDSEKNDFEEKQDSEKQNFEKRDSEKQDSEKPVSEKRDSEKADDIENNPLQLDNDQEKTHQNIEEKKEEAGEGDQNQNVGERNDGEETKDTQGVGGDGEPEDKPLQRQETNKKKRNRKKNKKGNKSADQGGDEQLDKEGGSDDEQYSGGEEEIKIPVLKFTFFYAADFGHKADTWLFTKVDLTLKDILDAQKELQEKGELDGEAKENLKDNDKHQERMNIVSYKATDKLRSNMLKCQECFPLPQNWFIDEKNDQKPGKYLSGIWVTANRDFNQIGLINYSKKQYLAFDCDYKPEKAVSFYPPEVARHFINPKSMTSHGRNQQTKEKLVFLTRIIGQGTNGYIIGHGGNSPKEEINQTYEHQIKFAGSNSLEHCHQDFMWWKAGEYGNKLVTTAVTITAGDQEIKLKTEIKLRSTGQKKAVERTSKSQSAQVSFPTQMYNIGQQKLIIQSFIGKGRQLVYELPKNKLQYEKFIDFVDQPDLQELGFHDWRGKDIKSQACATFCFLTEDRLKKRVLVNLMFVDPYYDVMQISLFQSTMYFDLEAGISTRNKSKLKDQIVKNIIYRTGNILKLVTQYPEYIHTVKMKEDTGAGQDSEETEEDDYQDYDREYDEEEDGFGVCWKYEEVPMVLDYRSRVYYVMSYDGQCSIYEINPADDHEHPCVCEIKAQKCLGFSWHQANRFFFIDENKIVNQLIQRLSGQLDEAKDLKMKPIDKRRFRDKSFSEKVITDRYVLYGSNIVYLFEDAPLQTGLLDMESLEHYPDPEAELPQTKALALGPVTFRGSSQFYNVYKVQDATETDEEAQGDLYTFMLRTYHLPDSHSSTLVRDALRSVSMTTFLNEDHILLQLGERYMIFCAKTGEFQDDADFDDIVKWREAQDNPDAAEQTKIPGVDAGEALEINRFNRMVLLQMSDNNEYFLFEDRLKHEYRVYTLVDALAEKRSSKGGSQKAKRGQRARKGLHKYEWKLFMSLTGDLDFFSAPMWQNIKNQYMTVPKGADEQNGAGLPQRDIEKLIAGDLVNLRLSDEGEVILLYNEDETQPGMHDTAILVLGTIFAKGKGMEHFTHRESFPATAKSDVYEYIEKDLQRALRLWSDAKFRQKKLPVAMRDPMVLQKYQDSVDEQEMKKEQVVFSGLYGEYLVVQCGRFLKWGKREDHDRKFDESGVQFPKQVMIQSILKTCDPHIVQIIARDRRNILIILTWDLKSDSEVCSFQMNCEDNTHPEHYIVKGLNRKRNYFSNDDQVYDLEYSIPIQKSFNFLDLRKRTALQLKARKIYKNGSRQLGINDQNLMSYKLTRMDVLFWKNVEMLGYKKKVISKIDLKRFHLIFDDYSLFHFFADHIEVIEHIREQYMDAKENGTLSKIDRNIPLCLLNPDKNGKTALDIAKDKEMWKSFELMIDMVEDFPDFCVSKLMLKSMEAMVEQGTDLISKFFNSAFYKPVTMQNQIMINWPKDAEEFIFASHTSLINDELIHKHLREDGLLSSKAMDELEESINKKAGKDVRQNVIEGFKRKAEELQLKSEEEKQQKEIRENLMNMDLDYNVQADISGFLDLFKKEGEKKRVTCQAIDFDWIFEGDNCRKMVQLLANSDNRHLLIQESFKTFVTLMWKYYYHAIYKRVFIPYLIYLMLFVILCSKSSGDFLDLVERPKKGDANFDAEKEVQSKIDLEEDTKVIIGISSVLTLLWIYFMVMELKQLRSNFWDYWKDYWNYIDFGSSGCNALFLVMILWCAITHDDTTFKSVFIREVGAWCAFLLWFKLFYWMRLFKSCAHFITLISTTIWDIRIFSFMLILILVAFANFFYVLNFNSCANELFKERNPEKCEGDNDFHYMDEYTGNGVFDAFIGIYLTGLGEFDLDGYKKGPNVKLAWFMFIACSFGTLIVFFNMLIAIMGDTFANVTELSDQNCISEQLALIEDFLYLLDLKKVFNKKRYIIRVLPDVSTGSLEAGVGEQINELGKNITKKIDHFEKELNKKIDVLDVQTRNMLKTQQAKIYGIQKILQNKDKEVK